MDNVLARAWRAHRAKVAAIDTQCAEIDAQLIRPLDHLDAHQTTPEMVERLAADHRIPEQRRG